MTSDRMPNATLSAAAVGASGFSHFRLECLVNSQAAPARMKYSPRGQAKLTRPAATINDKQPKLWTPRESSGVRASKERRGAPNEICKSSRGFVERRAYVAALLYAQPANPATATNTVTTAAGPSARYTHKAIAMAAIATVEAAVCEKKGMSF